MKLLTTQLANQDPLKPQDNGEFIAQLAQFSSLEKLTSIETSIKELRDGVQDAGGRPGPRPRRQHRRHRQRHRQLTATLAAACGALQETDIMAVGSFSSGLSGLSANSTYLSVIGNNLANINTVGYKTSAVSFADLVSQTVGGTSVNPAQVGLGVVTGSISPVFAQGSIENSREATNVAIQGAGFFAVRNGAAGRLHARRQLQLRRQRRADLARTAGASRATRRPTRRPATS